MAHRKCFNGVADDLNSGQYISRKKAKTIYKASVDLAQQPIPGVYQKKTATGQNKGIYVGDINISRGETPAGGAAPQQSGCLIGATSYASLSSVTEGKYLVDPINFDIRRTQDMWVGSIYEMDMSGATTLISYPGAAPPYNTFIYPPSSDSNQIYPNYPDPSNNNIGPVVDPCYNIFYPIGVTQSSSGICYLKNERAYKQYLKCLPFTTEQAKVYANAQNGYVGDIFYPKKFHFGCDQLWINDISHCLIGGSIASGSGSGNDTLTPTITGVNTSWGSVLNAEAVESPVYVGVTTSGVENGQLVTVTLNGQTYTANVSENSAIVTITAAGLQALPNGSYTITVNVSNTDGIAAIQFTSAPFTVDTTKPVLYQVTAIVTPSNNGMPTYVFNSTEAGTIEYSGGDGATSSTTNAIEGNNSIIFHTINSGIILPLAQGTYSNISITVTDAVGNVSNELTVPTFVIDTTDPVLTQVTAIETPSNDTEPTYVFNSTEAGTIEYSGGDGATSSTTNAIVGNNSIIFNTINSGIILPLAEGTYSNISITVTDAVGNVSNELTVPTFVIDTTDPVLTQVTAIETPSNDTEPTYVFNSTEAGTITYSGGDGATSSTTNAIEGNNSIIFNTLAQGTYSNISITLTDAVGNVSNELTVPTFVIDTTDPVLTQVTAIETPSNDTEPTYVFNSTEAGTIEYSGGDGATSSTTNAIEGNNSIIFHTMAEGTYSNISITVTDAVGNVSNVLTVPTFVIDTTDPVLTQVTAIETPSNDTEPTYVFNSTEAGTIEYSGGDGATSSTTNAIVGNNSIIFHTINSGIILPLAQGTYSNISITVTDDVGNVSNELTVPTFVIDTTDPVLTQVTAIETPSNDTEPTYVFNSTEAGTIEYSGGDGATSSTTNAIVGNNSIIFHTINSGIILPLAQGTYSNISITVTDAVGNVSNELTVPTFVIDTTDPVLTQVTAIETPSNDTEPTYVFNSTEAGTIEYSGGDGATSLTTNAIVGNNSIIFNTLAEGTYSNISITVTDAVGNVSNELTVPTFVIDTTDPVLTQVTAIETPSNDTEPTYVFNSTEAGTIEYSGGDGATSLTTNAIVGENSITFNTLAQGTYSNITIFVTDDVGNVSNGLTVPEFVIDTTKPTMTITSSSVADGATTTQALIALNFTSSEATNDFTVGNITVTNGSLSTLEGSGMVYTATFTPTEQGTCTIEVKAGVYSDANSNLNTASNTFTWTFNGTVIINGTGVFTNLSWTGAPAFEIGPGFTSVGDNALNGQTTITQVIIGNGVTSIDSAAFANCSNLTSVTFSSGSALQTIGSSAFSLSGLTGSIAIPKSVTSIGAQAFQNCSSLTSVTFDQDSALTTIGDFAFTSVAMNEITIPASVTSIGTQAFYGCSSLTTITFNQDSVLTTIGTYAFYSCTALSTITIPKLVTSIGTYTFYECSNLTSVSFDQDSALTTIGQTAFYKCIALSTITIPKLVTSIGNTAFIGCSNLTSVTFDQDSALQTIGANTFEALINGTEVSSGLATVYAGSALITTMGWLTIPPEPANTTNTIGGKSGVTVVELVVITGTGVFTNLSWTGAGFPPTFEIGTGFTSVEDNALKSEYSITQVRIGNEVLTIGQDAFEGCNSLTSVSFESGSVLTTIGMGAFNLCNEFTSIIIPTSVTSIGSSAFNLCYNLTSLSFESGSNLDTIGNAAFSSCSKLTSVIIPDNTTNIGWSSFASCTLLSSVTIGNSVTTIGNGAFMTCTALTEIVIPASVTQIATEAFQDCSNLKTVTFKSDNLTIGTDAFYNSGLATVYADSALISTMGWSTTSTNTIGGQIGVTVVGTVVITGNGVFTNLSWTGAGFPPTFEIGTGFTSVGASALSSESSITKVIIGKNVTIIGDYAFDNCSKLTSVIFDENSALTTIGMFVFNNTVLTKITIPALVNSIADHALSSNSLTSVIFDENSALTTIGPYVFIDTNLTTITLPASVESIGEYAFFGCNNLADVTFNSNNTLKAIAEYVFQNTGIKTITLPASVESIGESAFQDCSSLTTITLPTSLTSLEQYAFYNCAQLNTVTFEENSLITGGPTVIGSQAFYGSGLNKVNAYYTTLENLGLENSSGLIDFYGATSVEIIFTT